MKKIGRFLLKIIGWKIVGELPKDKKYMIIVAPHTSNWDFVIGLFGRFEVGVKINFLAKQQLFFFPLGNFLKAVGGFAVDRSKKGNTVAQIAELYQQRDEFVIAITPEGTRGHVTRWKEGFYHIAREAGISIVMIGLDYPTKEIRIHEPLMPSDDINKDFSKYIAFFRTISGCYPKEIPDYHPK
jgi:1-acyl-sn-glycerol-3-phosphate acyltransferase